MLEGLNLNERQGKAVSHLKTSGRIGNTKYQELFGIAKRTAHRDLTDLLNKGILEKVGTTGKDTFYILRKGAIKGPNGSSFRGNRKGATKGPNGP